jgi:hypothetical protein
MEKYAGEKKIVSHRYEKRNTVTKNVTPLRLFFAFFM